MVEKRQVSGRFSEEKLRKRLFALGGVVSASARHGRFRGHDGLKSGLEHQEQKFFAELFLKKATACF